MPSFSAALFATTPRTFNNEQSLWAHAILKEGSRPCWEIHIHEKLFRFIPDARHIVEDGLWQLMDYCQIPQNELMYDVSGNAPLTLEEEFGEEICVARRAALGKDMIDSGLTISLVTWPGIEENMLNQNLDRLKQSGINIIHQSIAN
jgi:hypothetical protein